MTGYVRQVVAGRAFGFIVADGRRTEFFFHQHDVGHDFDLKPGDRVVFDEVVPQPAKGPRAVNVALVSGQ
jgi:cold shock CspA family protein